MTTRNPGSKSQPKIQDDSLSLEDLDRVVGGGSPTSEKRPDEEQPPVVVQPVETSSTTSHPTTVSVGQQVASDGVTVLISSQGAEGQQTPPPAQTGPAAVTQIASHLNGADDAAFDAAGDRIVSMIQSRQVRSGEAMLAIHNSVMGGTLTGEQGIHLLGEVMMSAHYDPTNMFYPGNVSVFNAARNEISALINAHQVTADEAVTTLAVAAVNEDATTRYSAVRGMFDLASTFQTQPAQIVADIHGAMSHGVTGAQVVDLLGYVARYDASTETTTAVGAEIGRVVADPAAHVTAASAVGQIHDAVASGALWAGDAARLLVAVADHGEALFAAAGHEIAALVSSNQVSANDVISAIDRMATASTGAISGEHALELVMSLATPANTSVVVGELTNLIATGHLTVAQGMAEITAALANHSLDIGQATTTLVNLCTGASSAQVQSAAAAELGALISQGAVSATRLVENVHNAGMQPRDEIATLLALANGGSAAMQDAVGNEIASLITSNQISPYNAANVFGSLLGGNLDAAINAELASLIGKGAIFADLVVTQLTSRAENGFAINQYSSPWAPVNTVQLNAICNTISALVAGGQISAQAAMEAVSIAPYPYQTAQMLVQLAATANADVQAAAGDRLVAMCTTGFPFGGRTLTLMTSQATGAIGALLSAHTITVDQAVLVAAHLSSESVLAIAAPNQLAAMIGQGQLTATQAMSAIHAAVTTGHSLEADAARTFLTQLAAGNPSLQGDVNTELAALTRWAAGEAASVGDQIIGRFASGQETAAAAMAELDSAVKDGKLTVVEALSVLGSLAAQGGAAAQSAAGAGLAALLQRHPTMDQVRDAFAAAHLTGTQVITLLANAYVQDTIGNSNALGILYTFATEGVATGPQVAEALNGALGARQLSGSQALSIWGWLANSDDLRPAVATQIASLIGSQAVSIADVHTLVTQGRVPADQAMVGLVALLGHGGATTQQAVFNEITALIGAHMITADRVIAGIHAAMMPAGQSAALLTADQAFTALVGFAASGDAGVRSAVGTELAAILSLGQLNAGQLAADLAGLIGSRVSAEQALAVLVATASAVQPDGLAVISGSIVAMIKGNQVPLDQAIAAAAALPGAAGALHLIGNAVVDMAASGQLTVAALGAIKDIVAGLGMTAEQAAATLASAAAHGNAAIQAAAGAEFARLVGGGLLTPADAMAAIHAAIGTNAMAVQTATTLLLGMAPAATPEMLAAIGHELGALVSQGQIPAAQAVALLHDAFAGAAHVLSAGQATSLLCSLFVAGNAALQTAAMNELGGLVTSGQLPAAVLFANLGSGVAAGALTPDQAVLASFGLAGNNPVLLPQAVQAISALMAQGRIPADAVMAHLDAAIASGAINSDGAVTLLAAMAATGQAELVTTVGTEISKLVASGAISAHDAMADVGRAVTSGGMTADAAIGLLTRMSAYGTGETKAEAAKAIGALIAAGAITSTQALADITAILPLRTENSGVAFNAFYLLASVAAPAGLADELGVMMGDRINANYQNATQMAQQVIMKIRNAAATDVVTGEQALAMLAGVGAAVANGNNMSVTVPVNPILHQEIAILTRPTYGEISPVSAVETLHALAANGDAGMKAFVDRENGSLLANVQTLVDVGGRGIALTPGEAGARLSEMIKFGQLSGVGAINLIANEAAAHAFSPQAGLQMLELACRNENFFQAQGSESIAARMVAAGDAIAILVQQGLAPDAVSREINAAVGSNLVGPNNAAVLLAAAAMHGELRSAAASGIAALMNSGHSAADMVSAVLRLAEPNGGGMSPDQAIATLALVSASTDADAAIAGRLDQWIAPRQVVADVAALVGASGGLTGPQALEFLTSLAAQGSAAMQGNVGQALAAMVGNQQITIADIHAVVGSSALSVDAAVVMLTGMTQRGGEAQGGALAEIAQLISSGRISVDKVIADISGAYNQARSTDAFTGDQAAAVLATIGTPDAIRAIGTLCIGTNAGQVTPAQAWTAMMDVAGHLPVAQQATVLRSMLYTPIHAQWPDVGALVTAAVASHQLTGEQAVSVLAGVLGVPNIGGSIDDSARATIAALVAHGDVAPAQAMAAIDAVIVAKGMPVGEAVTLFGTMSTDTPAANRGAVMSAIGAELLKLVQGNQISVADLAGAIDNAVQTRAINVDQAVFVLAAADAASPATFMGAAANELAKLVGEHRITPAEVFTDIRSLLVAHTLDGSQAITLAMNMAAACASLNTWGNLGDSARGAFTDGVVAAVRAGEVSADQAFSTLAGIVGTNADTYKQVLAANAIGSLLAQANLPVAQFVSALHDTSLTVDQQIQMLANVASRGDATVQAGISAELARFVSSGQATAVHAAEVLALAASQGPAGQNRDAMQQLVGAEIAALIGANPAQRSQIVSSASVAVNDVNAVSLLLGVAAAGDLATQVAVGNEIGRKLTGSSNQVALIASIGDAIAAHRITAEQAVEVLAGTIAAPGTTPAIQTLAGAQIAAIAAHNQIAVEKIMADIHAAVVGHAVSPEQALGALAYISQGGSAAMQQAAIAEATALMAVRPAIVTAEQAIAALTGLAGAFHVPSLDSIANGYATFPAMPTVVGGMLAGLAESGLVTAPQVIAALGAVTGNDAASPLYFDDAVAVLIGMSTKGGPAAQALAGEAIASMMVQTGMGLGVMYYAVTSNMITVAQALTVAVNVSAALDPDAAANARHIDPAYYRSLVPEMVGALLNLKQITINSAIDIMLDAAGTNEHALLGVGAAFGGMMTVDPNVTWRANQQAADYVGTLAMQRIEARIDSGKITADQALIAIAGVAAGGHATEAAAEIRSLINNHKVTAEHVVDALALAGGHGNQTQQLAAGELLSSVVQGRSIPLEQALDRIGDAISSHAITADQGVAVLAAFAGAGDAKTQAAVGHELSVLVAQGQLTPAQAVSDIRAAFTAHTLTATEAATLMTGAIAAGTPAMRTAAAGEFAYLIGAGNLTAAQAATLIGDAVANGAITAPQALLALTSIVGAIAPAYRDGVAWGSYGYAPLAPDAFNRQVCSLVAAGRISADDAVATLAALAHDGSAATQLVVAGEIGALIADNRITAAKAIADIHAAVGGLKMTADQAVAVLTGLATAGTAMRDLVVNEIGALVAQGLSAERAMTAIADMVSPAGQVPGLTAAQAMDLLAAQLYSRADVREGSLTVLAAMIGHGQITGPQLKMLLDQTAGNSAYAQAQEFQLLAQLGGHGDASLQDYVHRELKNFRGIGSNNVDDAQSKVELLFGAAGASAGNPGVLKFVGSEIARFADSHANIAFTPGGGVEHSREDLVRLAFQDAVKEGRISSDQALGVFLGMYSSTASGPMHDVASYWVNALATSPAAFDMISSVLPPDEAVVLLSHMGSKGAVAEIGDMIASHKITAAQAIADIHNAVGHELSADEAFKALTGIVLNSTGLAQADANLIISTLATDTLAEWGVSTTASNYAALRDGMIEATQGFLSLMRGQTTIASLMETLNQHAADASIPVDATYAVLLRELQGWRTSADNFQAINNATNTVANEILDHFTETKHGDLADLVAQGALDRGAAVNLIRHIADVIAPTVMPYEGSLVGVTHAQFEAYYDQRAAIITTMATNMLDVNVAVAMDAPRILSGEMTPAQAIAHLAQVSVPTGFALDVGLAHLIEETGRLMAGLSGAARDAADAAHTTIMQALSTRIALGDTAEGLAQANHNRFIGANEAIAMVMREAGTGRIGDEFDLMQNLALCTLLEKSVSNVDLQHLIDGKIPFFDLPYQLLNSVDYVQKMLSGVSALLLLNPENMGDHLTWAKNLFAAYVRLTADPNDMDSLKTEAGHARQWYEQAWAVIDKIPLAHAFGQGVWLTADFSGLVGGDASRGDAYRGWANFGGMLVGSQVTSGLMSEIISPASVSVTLPGEFVSKVTTWTPQDLTAGTEISGGTIFTLINIASKALPMIWSISAISENTGPLATGMVKGVCGMVSACCDLVNNTISGAAVSQAMNVADAALNAVEGFNEIFNGNATAASVQARAEAIGKSMFTVLFAGSDADAVIAAGVDTGKFMASLFEGNSADIEAAGKKMGQALLNTVLSNRYLQVVAAQFQNFGQNLSNRAWEMVDTIGQDKNALWINDHIMRPMFSGW